MSKQSEKIEFIAVQGEGARRLKQMTQKRRWLFSDEGRESFACFSDWWMAERANARVIADLLTRELEGEFKG